MSGIMDFGKTGGYHSFKRSDNKEHVNYTTLFIYLIKLVLGIAFISSFVSTIFGLIKIKQLTNTRRQALINQYLLVIEEKNKLDYVSSNVYKEEQLRKLYGAYKPGEKQVILTEPIELGNVSYKNRGAKPREIWVKVLTGQYQ